MIYRLLIFLLLITACQRKTVPEKGQAVEVDIDTTLTLLSKDEIPENALKDIHHLLELGYKKANKEYDSIRFQMYFDAKMKDSIRIQSPGNNTVFLTIGNKKNKTIALYSYLDLLEFRFYGPEDHWTYIPAIRGSLEVDTTLHSYFKFRNLGPSYGVSRSSTPVLDSTKYRFNRWKNRLRMGSLYNLPPGHYGSTFIRKYKDEIIAHPEWRGKNKNGEYRKWKLGLKLCYLNPGVIELYKKDALGRLNKIKKKSSPPYFINMEPPDGDGFCICETCGKTVSDQVYGLANEIAEYLYHIDTNVIVTLYGYNEHAQAPSFPLHKNILVGIVPYAFQSLGSPEKMMEEWEETGAKLYLRDYLAIPVWNYDKAAYSPNNNFLSKINHIKDKKFWGYTFETTSSFMATGLSFYLLSSASWKQIDQSKKYQTFLKDMFSGYEDEISVIYENLPLLNGNTFADALDKIRSLKKRSADDENKQVVLRINDLEFYVEYLYLLNQFLSNETDENFNILLDKIMSAPGNRLLHPYGLYRVLIRKRKTERSIERTINTPVQIKTSKNIQLSLRRRVEKEYQALYPNFYLESLESLSSVPIRNSNGLLFVGSNHNGTVIFEAKLDLIYKSGSGAIIIRDMDNQLVSETNLISDNQFHEYSFELDTDHFYKVNFMTPSSVINFKGFNRPFAFTEPLFTRYLNKQKPFYFKIPNNQNDVIIQIPRKSNEVIVKSDKKVLNTHDQYEPYSIEIKNQQGNVIEVDMYRHGLELINIPHLLSLHPEAVIFQKNFQIRENQSTN